ncbi:uncharacterized protein LOC132552508 [Ylistrum balloti]|uniref:uncharacterized protein LOC132552508 n=1 Tax=Ylistrum balloti TaxID=509963 RepID=UPI002905E1ED|nr:uncharacterized protein LOC132552508 [Ylistrum balloti]
MSCFFNLRKLSVLLVSMFADLFDFVSDWLFYFDLVLSEDGLVFGPHEALTIKMTFVFCIIGSVTFVVEIIFNFIEYDKDNNTVEVVSEFVTFTTLLIEDLPQIAINVHIAMCREEATNTIQIVKASAAMFEVLIKLAFVWIKYAIKKRQGGREADKIRKGLTISTSAILVTIFALCATVFVLTINFQKSRIDFESDGLSDEETNKYLQGVGIFMSLNTSHLQIPNMGDNQWMRLVDLQEVTRLSDSSAGVVLSYMFTTLPIVYIWVRNHSTSAVNTVSCYRQESTVIHKISTQNCSDVFSVTANSTNVSLKFTYIPPNRQQPLGDIHSNVQVHLNKCTEEVQPDIVSLKYFQVKPEIIGHMTLTSTVNGDQYRYYNVPEDLLSVREVWKTGKLRCDNTGREGPKMDTKLSLSCLP